MSSAAISYNGWQAGVRVRRPYAKYKNVQRNFKMQRKPAWRHCLLLGAGHHPRLSSKLMSEDWKVC